MIKQLLDRIFKKYRILSVLTNTGKSRDILLHLVQLLLRVIVLERLVNLFVRTNCVADTKCRLHGSVLQHLEMTSSHAHFSKTPLTGFPLMEKKLFGTPKLKNE